MTAKPTTPLEQLRRAAFEQEQLRQVCQMKAKLERINTCVIDEATLDSLGVILGHPLDVDNIERPRDSGPRFFQPWVPNEILAEAAANSGYPLSWTDKLEPEYAVPEWVYGDCKARWFHGCIENLYEMNSELWEPWQLDSYTIKEGTGLDLPFQELRISNPAPDEYPRRQYLPQAAFFPVDKTKPHIACFTSDSNHAPGDRVLRSDVHYAIEMVKFRLEKGEHTGHHTKPAIIYTLERDQWARITQVHFDAKVRKLVLRQSRQLDLRGPEPTNDAYLLVRWMTSRPVGETEYVDEEGPREDENTSGGGSAAPKVLLKGCA